MISFLIPIMPYSDEICDITNDCLNRIHLFTSNDIEVCACINGHLENIDKIDLELIDEYDIFEEPIGNPAGWNEAYNLPSGDIVCFMDNDVLADTDWDKNILTALLSKELGIATPYLWWYKENAPTRLIDDNLQGCCMWMRRDTVDTLGYAFDERFSPAYAEDTDLFLRNNLYGFKRERIPGSTAFHYRGATCYKVFEKYGGIETVAIKSRKEYEEKWGHLGVASGGNPKCWEMWQ